MSENANQEERPAEATKTPVLSITVDLLIPVRASTKDGEKDLASVTLRRPKVGDQLYAQRGGGTEGEQEVRLFARLAGLNPEDWEKLDSVDHAKVQKRYLEAFRD